MYYVILVICRLIRLVFRNVLDPLSTKAEKLLVKLGMVFIALMAI